MKRKDETETEQQVRETEKMLRRIMRKEVRKRERAEEEKEGDQDVERVEDVNEVVQLVDVGVDKEEWVEMAVNEEQEGGRGDDDDDEWGVGVDGDGEEVLDPEAVKAGRRDEVEFMVNKLDMFEFGTWEEAWK